MTTQKLKTAWLSAVKNGKIVHDFKVNHETWQFGLKQSGKNISYFAKNLTKKKDISAKILERKISGTNFHIQFNEFRALRPVTPPKHLGAHPCVSEKARDCRFSCQDKKNSLSISQRDILESLKLKNYTWNFYSNAFPYDTTGHFLIIPSKKNRVPHLTQKFDKKLLTDVLDLFKKTEGLIVIFQSLHAGASVNHFHLQAFFHNRKYALESGKVFNNVLDNYPVPAFVYDINKEKNHIAKAITILQAENIPFDIICMNKRVYIFPRNPLHEVVSEFPTGPMGAMEIMGKFVTTDKKVYQNFDIHKLYRSLNKTCFEI